jgi:hypothetical protein
LHLPSAARIEKINDSEFELTVAGERLTISFQAAGDYELTIRDSWHSPEYFQLYPAKKLQFRTRAALPYFYSFEIKAL